MKTYRQIKEEISKPLNLNEFLGWDTPEISPIATPQAVDDVDSAAHSVEKPEMLEKLNSYTHDIANHQYMNPYYPLNALWKKLMMIGINFDLKKILMTGEQGRVEVPLSQFGGRFGVLGSPDGYVSGDDGIKDRVPGGLNLVVTYQKTGGVYSLDATIEHGAKAIGFGEEIVTEENSSVENHHPFGIAAVNNGYKHSQTTKVKGAMHHQFVHPKTGHSINLVNHGSNFWSAHVGDKQFRHSPGGADEVQQFHQHLGSLKKKE